MTKAAPTYRRDLLYIFLSAFFVTNAVLAEIMGGKLIEMGGFIMSIGVIPWPVVFITTDLINEYYGKDGVRRITLTTVGLIAYAFVLIAVAMKVPAGAISPVTDDAFRTVFGQSMWIIVGSMTAFAVSQLVDVSVFWFFRDKTKGKKLWLRATGSTVVSQLIDSLVVTGIAFWLPGKISTADFITLSLTNYVYKFLIAVGLTPLIYLAHHAIDRYLGEKASQKAKR